MFGLSVVSSEGYSTRQGLEELSEAALSVIETAKLCISWTDLIAFLLEVLHFNILFFSDTCLINYLNNLLVYNSENLYHFFRFMVAILVSLNVKKVTRKHFNVVFWGKASSPFRNVGATWQPEHKYFHSVLLTTDKQYLECLTPGVFTEACKKLEFLKAIVSIFPL